MKTTAKILSFIITAVILLSACGPKPQYRTRLGKKKLKYYNSVQYDKGQSPKTFKSFKNR
ncbi:hypothetical protein E1176_09570 [Fulvivirga sp. RKSG066]|uniref:hypothetical protein n=1 Tax=Fulvivirga aurantia TaxID=2529383 RepID=UPI0012BD6D01|nr:hypothetical protein [Fulvivirga aurantia]MTI21268.1 hypothetical protein [Fulvivirga aurantia]